MGKPFKKYAFAKGINASPIGEATEVGDRRVRSKRN